MASERPWDLDPGSDEEIKKTESHEENGEALEGHRKLTRAHSVAAKDKEVLRKKRLKRSPRCHQPSCIWLGMPGGLTK